MKPLIPQQRKRFQLQEHVSVLGLPGRWVVDEAAPGGWWLRPDDSPAQDLLSRTVFDRLLSRAKDMVPAPTDRQDPLF